MTKREAKRLAITIIGNEYLVNDGYTHDMPDDEEKKVRAAIKELGGELFRRAGLNDCDHLFSSIDQMKAELGIKLAQHRR